MSVNETMIGRLKKLLRVKFDIKTGSVAEETALGENPIGFDDTFIQTEFVQRLNLWFEDLMPPFPAVTWSEDTTLSDLVDAILNRSPIKDIKKAAVYRAHVLELAEAAFDSAAGQGAQSVPVASRPQVQSDMNEELESSLIRNISLDDLAGDRATILSNVIDRMVI
jgi:hypothetical protein